MHILFLSDNFPPEVNAPASRTYEHCREWVRNGEQVTVITCAPNFPKGKLFPGYRNRLWQPETMDGIRVIRVWTYITANEGFARRVLDYVSFMLAASLAALFVRKIDVVVGTSPQFFTACAAWFVSGARRRPFVFELRDLWPETIEALVAVKVTRVLDAFERLEIFLYQRADRIVSVTNAFKRNLIERGIDGEKIRVVTNGVDLTRFTPQPRMRHCAQPGLEGRFIAGYIGTLGLTHALETAPDAAHIAQEGRTTRWLSCCSATAPARRRSRSEAKQAGLRNVHFIDSVPKDLVPGYWAMLDAADHSSETHDRCSRP